MPRSPYLSLLICATGLLYGCARGPAAEGGEPVRLIDPRPIFERQQSLASCDTMDSISCNAVLLDQCTMAGSSYLAADYSCLHPDTAAELTGWLDGDEWTGSFTAPESGDILISVGSATDYAFIAVVRDDPGTCLKANWYSITMTSGVDFTPGETLTVIIDHTDENASMGFNINLDCAPEATEINCDDTFDNDADYLYDCDDDDCIGSAACPLAAAVDSIGCGDTLLAGATTDFGASDIIDAYTRCAPLTSTPGPEYIYEFNPTTSETVNFTLSAANNFPFLAVVKDNGNGCYVPDCVVADFYSVVFDAEAGERYYLIVDGEAETGFNYQASLVCPVAPGEINCSDGIDEDGDTRIDCRDTECLGDELCNNSTCSAAQSLACGDTTSGSIEGNEATMSQYSCMPGLNMGGPEQIYSFSYSSGPDEQEVMVALANESSYATISVIEESPVYTLLIPLENRYSDVNFAPGFFTLQNLLGAGSVPQPDSYKYPMYAFFEPDCQIDDGFCPAASCNDTGNIDALIERMGLVEGVDVWRVPAMAPGDSIEIEVQIPVTASFQYNNPNYNYLYYFAPLEGYQYEDNFVRGGYVFWGEPPSLTTTFYSYLYDVNSTVGTYQSQSTPQNDCATQCPAPESCNIAYYARSVAPQETLDVTSQTDTCHPLACVAGNFYGTSFTAQRDVTYYFAVEGYYEQDVSFDMAVFCDAPATEDICDDGFDNDGDFLDDCADPDCDSFCTAGDLCSATGSLDCSTVHLAGSISAGSGNIDSYICEPELMVDGAETAYAFHAEQSGWVNFTTNGLTDYVSVAVIENTGICDPYNCLGVMYYGEVVYVEAGVDYFVVVDAMNPDVDVDFEISVVCDAPGSEVTCDDNIDDDGDFLTDCDDPDCSC